MGIYIFNVCYPFIIFVIGTLLGLRNRKLSSFLLLCVAIYLFVFLALFNYQTFPDIDTYNEYYSFLSQNTIEDLYYYKGTLMEYGYLLFNKILTFINSDPRTLYITRGIIFSICITTVIKKHSYNHFITVVFFFLIFGLNQSIFVVRQYLAIAIYLLSISYILNKNIKRYLIIWLIAFSIHKSLIVCLPLYWLYHNFKLKKDNVLLVSIIFILGSFLLKSIVLIAAERFGIYGDYLLNMGDDGNSVGLLLRALCIFVPFILFGGGNFDKDNYYKLFYWTSLLNVVMSIVLVGVPSGSRLYPCYNSFSMLVIPYIASCINSKRIRISLIVCLVLIFLYLYFLRISNYNYYFMWQECNEYYTY